MLLMSKMHVLVGWAHLSPQVPPVFADFHWHRGVHRVYTNNYEIISRTVWNSPLKQSKRKTDSPADSFRLIKAPWFQPKNKIPPLSAKSFFFKLVFFKCGCTVELAVCYLDAAVASVMSETRWLIIKTIRSQWDVLIVMTLPFSPQAHLHFKQCSTSLTSRLVTLFTSPPSKVGFTAGKLYLCLIPRST